MPSPGSLNKPYQSVQQHEPNAPSQSSPPPHRGRPFWEKLGLYNIGIIVLGTIAIAVAVGFLAFLWAGAATAIQNGNPVQLWHDIVDRAWATRLVTLSSVLIRVATAAQLGVFTAIIAAIILETVGVPTRDFALLSIVRTLNTGPQSLSQNILHSMRGGAQIGYSIIIILAMINALALQFTSTILLTDFGTATVVFGNHKQNVSFGISYSDALGGTEIYKGVNMWKTGTSTYPRFAEYHEPGSNTKDYMDTGKTYRGFLPFSSSEDRRVLRNYTGPMTVIDSRVICMKPSIQTFNVDFTLSERATVAGVMDGTSLHPSIALETWDTNFNCSISLPMGTKASPFWPISLCEIATSMGGFMDGLRTDEDMTFSGYTETYLLLNATGAVAYWEAAFSQDDAQFLWRDAPGPWVNIGYEDVGVDITLCFANPLPWDYVVEISSEQDFVEPTLGWNNVTGSYVTSDIRAMLGAIPDITSTKQRGLWDLMRAPNWSAATSERKWGVKTNNFIWSVLSLGFNSEVKRDKVLPTAMFDPVSASDSVHRSLVAVIQDILEDTRNPALALQALFTLLMQIAYYDFLPQFDVSGTARYRVSSEILLPVQWKGFSVVVGLIGLHFVLIALALILFFVKTEMSLLGNSWQAVGQVISKDTSDAVHYASTLTDSELKTLLKKSGAANGRLWIKRAIGNGRVEAVSRNTNSEQEGFVYSTGYSRP
ncbi:hypothetical protein IQ07DRAFT_644885 [Pyrenochaeta sp. DS3sAY3a]|nr:hypothetical protein IQ07DRAFT_644885 [Pyrenochaeta sp. DS3sAY3a]